MSCFFTSIFILFYFLLLFFPSLPSFLFYYILSYFFFCLFFFPFFFFSYPFSVFFSFFPSIHWNCRTRNHFLIEVREVIHNNKTCQSSPSKLNYPRFSFLLSFSVPPYQFSSSFLNSAYFSLLNYYTSSPPPPQKALRSVPLHQKLGYAPSKRLQSARNSINVKLVFRQTNSIAIEYVHWSSLREKHTISCVRYDQLLFISQAFVLCLQHLQNLTWCLANFPKRKDIK